jgi:hypothetical protein
MKHELKTLPAYFDRLEDGSKTFEVRRDDRGFQMGDELWLREYDPDRCVAHNIRHTRCAAYTGRELEFKVGFVFKAGVGVDLGGYVILSLLPMDGGDPS